MARVYLSLGSNLGDRLALLREAVARLRAEGLSLVAASPLYESEPPPPRYNGAPGQQHWVIRQHPETGARHLDRLWWGLIPHWSKDPTGGRKPINAKSETVARLPTFREAYQKRRCILPVDGFYEWRATKQGKQPYAIAMKDRSPFGIAALWENWQDPATREWVTMADFEACQFARQR